MMTFYRHRALPLLKTFHFLLAFSFFSFSLFAQENDTTNPWVAQVEASFATKAAKRQIIPDEYRTYTLDKTTLQALLRNAPPRFSGSATDEETILQLPMPDGRLESFRVYNAPVLAPGLAARFPTIRAYAGIGIDDPTASVRFDFTPAGFHGMILSARHGTVFIDPYAKSDTDHYIVYYRNDYTKTDADFACHTVEENHTRSAKVEQLDGAARSLLQGDCRLRTYRLALTCTGEYAQFHGGTVENVLAAMSTSMTRVNGVFERDVNATMEIVDSNDLLIFLNPANDPYNDGNPGQMIGECHDQCVDIIGINNFDIGHIFSTQGGGLAGLGVICNPNRKGNGVTGIGTPVGDPFDIDYVAHEIGHQFGAGHTQNNDCNRSGFSAMEPGSASTIMGYAGICGPNVQNNSDAYFHAISIQQMSNYINNGLGDVCATFVETGNTPPSVNDVGNYTLPISTPFQLTAIGEDADGDALTYCWEQMDNEVGNMPPLPTNTQGPIFRSFDPTENPTRYFPRLSDLLNDTAYPWESLPAVSRDVSFRVTVRDNSMGGGCTTEDDVELSFTASAGPFVVQNPNVNLEWVVGQTETVTWDVANTDAAPVNCAEVDIVLSLDGGLTYPITLVSQVPNNGSYTLQVPNEPTATARIMVICSDNIFFDISNENFSIVAPTEPTFVIETTPITQEVCGTIGSVDYDFNLFAFAEFDQTVTLSTTGVPDNATVVFSENDTLPPFVSTLTIGNLTAVENGTYVILLNASSDSVIIDRALELTVTNGTIDVLSLATPTDGASDQELNVGLSWEAISSSTGYVLEIATSPAFGATVVETAMINESFTAYQAQNLMPFTVYYWRVAVNNICGQGAFSDIFTFQTRRENCITYSSENLPLIIPADTENTVVATLDVPDDFTISAITSSMEIIHSWVGDLAVVLQSPQGVETSLFDQPGIDDSDFGCDENNLLLTFDDAAEEDAAALAATCGDEGGYAINGTFQPIDPLSNFAGSSPFGEWSLTIIDNFAQDGGQLETWSLDICFEPVSLVAPTLVNNVLVMETGTAAVIPNSHLLANWPGEDASLITFTLLSLPVGGTLALDGSPVAVGTTFTQADINNGALMYTNTDIEATQDEFRFNVVRATGAWIPNETFTIEFGTPTLVGAAYESGTITCVGGTDGQITVNATGPDAPFMYSLDGVIFQEANLFDDLAAGTYQVTVVDALGNSVLTNAVTLVSTTNITVSTVTVGNTLSVTAVGGTGTLSYSIDGENFQTEEEFTDLPNGTYEVMVIDENGCVATSTATINIIESATVMTTDPSCANGEDGTLIITEVTGGNDPYEYSINGQDFFASNSFEDLLAGTYMVTVMDAMGNTFDAGTYTLEDAPALMLTAEAIENTITVMSSGGTGQVQYSINGGITFQSSNTFTDLPNGVYLIIAMDENGCTVSSDEITINIVGLNDLTFDLNFNLFPNPVHTQLTLELQQPTARDIRIRIYDVAGRLLQEQQITKVADYLKTVIDVQQLPAGSYELIVSDGLINGRGRFVKM